MPVAVTSQTRLHPLSAQDVHTTSLSVLDAVSSNYAPCGALWAFDHPIDPDRLRDALAATLDAYRHFAGQLEPAPYEPDRGHSYRHGRLQVTFGKGASGDPGLLFVVAQCDRTLASAFPSSPPPGGFLDMDGISIQPFLPTQMLPSALGPPSAYARLSPVQVQLTGFSCSGCALGVQTAHPLADAQTLTQFVHHLAATYRSFSIMDPLLPVPVFLPELLDNAAYGDIDAPTADFTLLASARSLPQLRFDWWAPESGGDNCPAWAKDSTLIPPHIDRSLVALDPMGGGIPMPWHEWDALLPVRRCVVSFEPREVHGIWLAACLKDAIVSRISHLDALLAHIWLLVNRARVATGVLSAGTEVYLSTSLGARDRLQLPATLCGSPIIHTRASTTATSTDIVEAPESDLGILASAIRTSVTAFDAPALGAALHELAHSVYPSRMWTTFLGCRNVLVTSWLRLDAHTINFQDDPTGAHPGLSTGRPRYVEALMPAVDGLVQVMEGPSNPGGVEGIREGASSADWWARGAAVTLSLTGDVMDRVLSDPLLRQYR